MSDFNEQYPFGVDRLIVHLYRSGMETKPRIIINPNIPESVYNGLQALLGYEITRLTVTAKIDPDYEQWKSAVAQGATRKSFEEWNSK